MPGTRMKHCFVKITNSTAMLLGGHSDPFKIHNNDVWTFAIAERNWTIEAPMPVKRNGHTCQALIDSGTNVTLVIVFGGVTKDSIHEIEVKQLDILNVETGSWKSIYQLPQRMHSQGVLVQFEPTGWL